MGRFSALNSGIFHSVAENDGSVIHDFANSGSLGRLNAPKRMRSTMKTVLVTLLWLLASTQARADIHYIGFNQFGSAPNSSEEFSRYLSALSPIMARHGMTLTAYDVVHGGERFLSPDVVTFGSAPDEASFQAFFADEQFLSIFPTLVGALSDHQVIFTQHGLASAPESLDTRLELSWSSLEAGSAQAIALDKKIEPELRRFDVERPLRTTGLMSNRGLAGDLQQTTPPDQIELWTFTDAHEFMADKKVQAWFGRLRKTQTRSAVFWLQRRTIR